MHYIALQILLHHTNLAKHSLALISKRVLVGVCSNIQADAHWKDLETLVFKNVIIDLTGLWIDLPQTLGFASCLVLYTL